MTLTNALLNQKAGKGRRGKEKREKEGEGGKKEKEKEEKKKKQACRRMLNLPRRLSDAALLPSYGGITAAAPGSKGGRG